MTDAFFSLLFLLISYYLGCWLGVELLAYNWGYSMTHLQLFFIPAICFLSFFIVGKKENETLQITNRVSLQWKYITYSGKLSLCLWAMKKSIKKNKTAHISIKKILLIMRHELESSKRVGIKQIRLRTSLVLANDFDYIEIPGYIEKKIKLPNRNPVFKVARIIIHDSPWYFTLLGKEKHMARSRDSYEVNWNYAK